MRGRSIAYLVSVVLLLMFSAGCKRIPLYDRSTAVRIVIDQNRELGHEIEFSYETDLEEHYQKKIDGTVPTYYEVLVYDEQTHNLHSSHIVGEYGGTLALFPGNYNFVIYSFGTESTQVDRLHHRHEAEAFTTDITALKSGILKSAAMSKNGVDSKGYEDDPIIHEPDHLYVSNEQGVAIDAFMGTGEEVVVYTTTSTILDVYSLEVLNIKGVENIEKIEAFITGQILSNHFGRPARNNEPATLYVEMSTDVKNSRLYTVFNTFGKLPGEENKIFLDITVTDSDGGQYRYIFDVTDQFDDPTNGNHKLIIDGGDVIDIPKAEHAGGGFMPSVDEWEREDIDVPLG